MQNIVVIPVVFLLVTLALKCFRLIPPKKKDVIKSIIELTFDWMILNMGLYASYVSLNQDDNALIYLLTCLLAMLVTFGCSQTAVAHYEKRTKHMLSIWVFSIISYILSIGFYVFIVIQYSTYIPANT